MLIRSTWSSRLNYLTSQTNRISSEMGEVNQRISTGIAVQRPSDAPELTGRIMNIEREISDQQRYNEDATQAANLHDVTDTVLRDLGTVVSEARTLAVQMGTDTYEGDLRVASAGQVDALLDEAHSLMNSEVGGRYLFSGEAYDTPPYDSDFNYQGGADPSTITVSGDVDVVVGFNGDALGFGDIISSLESLRDALLADDADSVSTSLEGLNEATNHIAVAQTKLGIEQMTALDFASFTDSMAVELETQLSNLQDDDTISSLVRMSELQTQYEAAIAMTSQSQMGNLFSRI